jgi:glutathione S-transferase
VDGDLVLTESRAIMQYLASRKPESGLLPRDEAARADVTRWQFWDAAHFSPQLGTLGFEKVFKAMMGLGEPDVGKIQEALSNFRRFAAVLNKRLEGKQYIVGSALTVADLTIASSLMYAKQAEVPLAEFPNVQAWFSRITGLEGWKKTSLKRLSAATWRAAAHARTLVTDVRDAGLRDPPPATRRVPGATPQALPIQPPRHW